MRDFVERVLGPIRLCSGVISCKASVLTFVLFSPTSYSKIFFFFMITNRIVVQSKRFLTQLSHFVKFVAIHFPLKIYLIKNEYSCKKKSSMFSACLIWQLRLNGWTQKERKPTTTNRLRLGGFSKLANRFFFSQFLARVIGFISPLVLWLDSAFQIACLFLNCHRISQSLIEEVNVLLKFFLLYSSYQTLPNKSSQRLRAIIIMYYNFLHGFLCVQNSGAAWLGGFGLGSLLRL